MAGIIVVLGTIAFFAYYIPARVRTRQVMGQARLNDRYSPHLRVVSDGHRAPLAGQRPSGEAILPRSRHSEKAMTSPVARKLAAADARRVAAARAAHAAAISRRRAAAARRRVLLGALLAVTVVGLVVAGFTPLPWAVVLIPGVLAGGVLGLGIRANQQAQIADVQWEAQIEQARQPLAARGTNGADGEAGPRHSTGNTRLGRVQSEGASSLRMDVDPTALFVETEVHGEAEGIESTARSWTPVPVPAPTYTMKATAPRRVVPAYEAAIEAHEEAHHELAGSDQPAAHRSSVSQSGASQGAAPAPDEGPAATDAAAASSESTNPADQPDGSRQAATRAHVDVQQVLARRRAAG